ncbi:MULTISPECIES: dihydrodipicolinate synthase family protein [Halocynthiibacter]|uniref:Dihydrodipicolinate synthase family protein n=1 Tax=Halocynthiibacter halioticoli TaxID=2986804 RepID=A0AAE3LRN7_9RHOB|nr:MULTISPECIES: dihydrodipicolinate synthase family protein [Halocynthiibacter]MCV6824803.1 dihydrodipicolinate synthase family protein [Halocynthiibacter halioticoli]MCW4057804.1 dihydrodipicolinate synthase family protein [Halocynthiibacter sp. SDUM655004]
MTIVNLPTENRTIEPFKIDTGIDPQSVAPITGGSRVAFAAAHVVVDPFADVSPMIEGAVDWDKTLAFREHIWSLGFGVAEAMDTAQRGMGMDWPTSLELIQRSVKLAKSGGHLIACGAGTDHLEPSDAITIDDVIAAYEMQCEAVEAAGGQVILMASRALAKAARSPDDYKRVYTRILSGLQQPAILHWLGDMFDPALAGYWGSDDLMAAMETCLEVIETNAARVDGIKVSLLSAEKEIVMRRRLPEGVRMYTGDDFNYPDLIAGDEQGYSHALLGIFDPIAAVAAKALNALEVGNTDDYSAIFAPTVPLSRHIFKAPTRFYKTGVVFLAYLNGHQDHFTMLGGQQSGRSALHFADIIRLGNVAGMFPDPEMSATRAARVFATMGIEP